MKKAVYVVSVLLVVLAAVATSIVPNAAANNSCGSLTQDCYPKGTNRCYRAPDGTLCMKNLAVD
jgi:hypothetical protein